MKKKPPKRRCSCGKITRDFYCSQCAFEQLNKIIAAGGRRNPVVENKFDNLIRY